MASLVAAISRASTSAVRRAKAFFEPSGLKWALAKDVHSSGGGIFLNKPDECINLDGIDIVEFLQSLLDLSLVRLNVDDEYKSIILLNLLHSTLGVERVDDNLVLIETGLVWN